MTSDTQKHALDRWYSLIEKNGFVRTSCPDVACKCCGGWGHINNYDLDLALHSVETGSELQQCDECGGLGIDLDAVENRMTELTIPFELPGSVDEQSLLKCVDEEEELPGPMPNDVWLALIASRESATMVLRAIVKSTKKSIRDRLLSVLE